MCLKEKRINLMALFFALILCAGLIAPIMPPALATSENAGFNPVLSATEKADALHALGLFNGTGTDSDGMPIYDLDQKASRNQAAAMLIRLLGKENKAAAQYAAGALKKPFDDLADWIAPSVAWLYETGQINGMTPTTFSGVESVTARQFCAMILRSLGYSDAKGDFSYAEALEFAVKNGLLTDEQSAAWSSDFRREGVAEICYNALYANMKNSRLTLFEKLTNDGVFKNINYNISNTAPVKLNLKYKGGGHLDNDFGKYWVEEPAITASPCADIDGDGKQEILFFVRSLICLDAATGKVKWHTPSGHDVSENLDFNASIGIPIHYMPPQIADLDGDSKPEIITFSRILSPEETFVAIYDGTGHFKTHWTMPYMAHAVKIADFDNDGKQEIAVGLGVGEFNRTQNALAVYIYNHDGSLRDGWPQDCGYGLFANSMEAIDLDGDGQKELVMLDDQEWMNAFYLNGDEVIINGGPYDGKKWRNISIFENYENELRVASGQAGYDNTRESVNAIMGTHGGLVASDLDGDGKQELICTAMIVNLQTVGGIMAQGELDTFNNIAQYFTSFILNLDHSRYSNAAKGFDWSQMPTDIGEIVTLDNPKLDEPDISPVVADIDGDGNQEIIFTSNDGKIHCFHADGAEHGAWPYALDSRTTSVPTFASKPAVGDVNGDGKLEIIFATYTRQDQVTKRGELYILDYTGKVLDKTTLPIRWGAKADDGYANGSQAEPILADVDNDGKLEIIITTYTCGVCVYEIE